MKIPCPDCKGNGWKHFYGSTHTKDVCAECKGKGEVDFVEKPQSPREQAVCGYCGQEGCASLFGAPLCGPIE